jgi:alkanesulfonate monooxygenase SsuD/methylene tetrahydromethanopterin reductase-like flavin-dependent oxidoreductase (luciferase family)
MILEKPRMSESRRMEFGYSPPVGDRGAETIRPSEFVPDLRRVLDVAAQGFSSFWVSDHLMFEAKYRLECWTELAWIAGRYLGKTLGTLVLCNGFRNPALMAKMAASLQTLSGGRFILGYGAGWHAQEHEAYGFPFPAPAIRLAMLDEGVQVIRALWTQAPANFAGQYYRVTDVYCEPRPAPPPPLMIGGSGERHTLRLVARHADWWNDAARPPAVVRRKLSALHDHCQAVGRSYDSIRKTLMVQVIIDRSQAAALNRAGDRLAGDQPPVAGDPSAIRDRLTEYAELGISLCQIVFPNFPGTDDMRLFMDEVLPAFA